MKLVFNTPKAGIGNNGGSRTIILCTQALNEMGHDCSIVSNVDNFTWFDHKPLVRHLPLGVEALIAVANADVIPTIKSSVKKRAWWIRGHETWSATESQLTNLYNIGLFNIVNSYGLKFKLESLGAKSVVVYQGVDLDFWYDSGNRGNKIRIGCLYNNKPTKRWKDFVELSRILGTEDYEFIGIGDNRRSDAFLYKFWHNATREELIDIYSSCHYWFVPTELEGLHNVPMEAGLCGCKLVCTNHLMGGTLDYSVNGDTSMVYEAREIDQAAEFIKNPTIDNNDKLVKLIKYRIGDRRQNMRKLIRYMEEL
jgi:hypothetical protein